MSVLTTRPDAASAADVPKATPGTAGEVNPTRRRDAAVGALGEHLSPFNHNADEPRSHYRTLLKAAAEAHADVVASRVEPEEVDDFTILQTLLLEKRVLSLIRENEAVVIILMASDILGSRNRMLTTQVSDLQKENRKYCAAITRMTGSHTPNQISEPPQENEPEESVQNDNHEAKASDEKTEGTDASKYYH